MEQQILLTPGPVMVSERVRNAMMRPILRHREEEFSKLLQEVREKIKIIAGVDDSYTVILMIGSATAVIEASILSIVDRKILVIKNGVYGDRMEKMPSSHGIQKKVLSYPWDERPDPEEVEKALAEDPQIDTVGIVHVETTTGIFNPVDEIGPIVKRYNKVFITDSVSVIGGDRLNIMDDGIDVCIGTSNKCIQALPGVAFAVVKKEVLEKRKGNPRSVYLNLHDHYEREESGFCPFTPATQIIYTLDEALDELMEEGVENRIRRYDELARFLREGLAKLGLKILIPSEYSSNSITTVFLPEGVSYGYVHDRLKEKGFVICPGLGRWEGKTFRVCNMGNIDKDILAHFLGELEIILA